MPGKVRARILGRMRLSGSLLIGLMAIAALCLAVLRLLEQMPVSQWLPALLAPEASDPRQMAFHHALLPRMVIAPVAGAILGLAGAIFQQVLRNPLAEPTTLGVAAGAHAALVAVTLFAPALLDFGRDSVALAGGASAILLVLATARGRGLAPLAVILSGLLMSLFLGAAAAALVVLNHDYLTELYIWQSGSLIQTGWGSTLQLLVVLPLGLAAVAVLARGLTALDIEEAGARSLGVPVQAIQILSLMLALLLSTAVIARLGVVGFVGLAAPAFARLSGARILRQRLVNSALFGGVILFLADQLVQALPLTQEIPTGTATAVLGALLLLWLSSRASGANEFAVSSLASADRDGRAALALSAAVALIVLALGAAIFVGRGPGGWHIASLEQLQTLWPWRAPRAAASFASGILLGTAGVLMQRLTGNPMAAPEILGISAGASVGLIVVLLALPGAPAGASFAAAGIGAAAALAMIALAGSKASFAPQRLLLSGASVATLCSGLTALALASGDPRLGQLVAWLAGTTAQVSPGAAMLALGLAATTLTGALLTSRWLAILPLGGGVSRSLGIGLGMSRLAVLSVAAVATAGATLIVGPLTFVGLMGPHIARLLGFRQVPSQLVAASLAGGGLMILADWLARNLLFPWQLPTGIVATLLAGPFMLALIQRPQR